MDITATDIKKFKELYVKQFEIVLDDRMARVKLLLLVRQMEIVYKPLTKEQWELIKDEDVNEIPKNQRPQV